MRQIRNIGRIAFLIIIFSLLPMTSVAENSSLGVISGKVLNKTLNHKGMEGLEVILQLYVEGRKSDVYRTRTDKDGFYSFQKIIADQNAFYQLTAKYKNIEHYSQAIQVQGKSGASVDLSVYETTDQDNDIHIKMHHIFFETENGSFQINEAIIVENRGNRVYIGNQEVRPGVKETLRISLPKEAFNLQFEQHLSPFIVNMAEGFVDTSAIKPGTRRIQFSYALGPTDLNYAFTKGLYHQTENLIIVFPDQGFQVKSDQLDLKGPMINSGQQYYNLSGKNFTKGSQIAIELSPVRNKNPFQWIIVGMLILLAGIGFTLSFIKQKNFRREADGQTPVYDEIDLTEQRLAALRAIAQLDDHAESGDVNMDAYHMKRAALLIKAKELSRQLRRDG